VKKGSQSINPAANSTWVIAKKINALSAIICIQKRYAPYRVLNALMSFAMAEDMVGSIITMVDHGVVCAGPGIKIIKIVGSALTADRNDVRRISGMTIGCTTQSAKGRSVRGIGGALRTTRTRRARTRMTTRTTGGFEDEEDEEKDDKEED
jgi:hypothetical protein